MVLPPEFIPLSGTTTARTSMFRSTWVSERVPDAHSPWASGALGTCSSRRRAADGPHSKSSGNGLTRRTSNPSDGGDVGSRPSDRQPNDVHVDIRYRRFSSDDSVGADRQ